MGDAPQTERWSFWIEDAVRAVCEQGFAVVEAPERLRDRRAVLVAERDGSTRRCTLVDERTGAPSTEVRCRADGVPVELTVRPELVGEGFDKLIGMTVDQLVGDAEFDRDFVIASAPRSIAVALLQASVREKISALPRTSEGPALRLKEGELSLRWWAEPDSDHLRAAVEVVAAVQALHRQMVGGGRGDRAGAVPAGIRGGSGGRPGSASERVAAV